MQIERGAVTTVRFDTPVRRGRDWLSTAAAVIAGCCLAAIPQASQKMPQAHLLPVPPRAKHQPSVPVPPTSRHVSHTSRLVPPRSAHHDAPQIIRIVLPPAEPVEIDIPSPAAAIAPAPSPIPVPTVASPATESAPLRPVDVAQISDSEVRSLAMPELHEPGLVAGEEPNLSAKIADMQVTPPPPVRLRDSDRAALLAEAPTRMMVRIGGAALGTVDFHITDARTIDVRLGNLLDLLAGHYDAAEFSRLRSSAAADAYVSFDQLRALGLNVRYNPAYDELQISG